MILSPYIGQHPHKLQENDRSARLILQRIPVEGFSGLDAFKITRTAKKGLEPPPDGQVTDDSVFLTPEQRAKWRKALDANYRHWLLA